MSTPPDDKRDLSGPLSIVVLLLLLLAVIGVVLWWLLPTPKSVAAFGDAFGGVAGTLVSGVALVLLVFTVLQQQRALKLQREELSLQRKELQETREELKRSADAQNEQVNVAQMAARLNATSALLDSASQELASFGMYAEDTKKGIARKNVAQFRAELETQRKELSRTIEGSVSFSGTATLTANGEVKRKDA
jgi:hypothetical protein